MAAEVEKFTLDQAKSLWNALAGADRAHLYVVGRFDPAAVRTAIEEAFGGLAQGEGRCAAQASPEAAASGYSCWTAPGRCSPPVRFGLPVIPPTSPDYIPLVVTNAMLGGSFGSRITANIREKPGYTYSPGACWAPPRCGTWAEAADVTTKDTAASVREMVNEIERLRKEPHPRRSSPGSGSTWPGPSSSGTAAVRGSSPSSASWTSTGCRRTGSAPSSSGSRRSRPRSDRDTKKYLDPREMTLVVVGDRKVVEDSLKQFGPVKVEAPQ